MSGFFSKTETESKSRPDGRKYSCSSCGLYKNALSPRMDAIGDFAKRILIISSNPTDKDDRKETLWTGNKGRLLKNTLAKFNIDLFEDCMCINAVNCTPYKDDDQVELREPSKFEMDCCHKIKISSLLNEYKPRVILLLGNNALYSIIGKRWKKDLGSIAKWRGFTIPDQELGCWICPTFDVDFLEYNNQDVQLIWERDIEQAVSLAVNKIKIPKPHIPNIHVIEDLSIFDSIPRPCKIAFDYETTGIKPHSEDQKIICASVANSIDNVFVFMIPKKREKLVPFLKLLQDPLIQKIAQNAKYEDTWTYEKLETEVVNWEHDTMLASHMIDNRPGITGLKFQVYVNFGVIDYDSEIAPYLEAKDADNANSINRIEELIATKEGEQKLLTYCAMDSIWEMRLYEKQIKLMEDTLPF